MGEPQENVQAKSTSPFVVEPRSRHTHTFILLHGLGSNGRDFGRDLLETGVTSDGRKLKELLSGAKFVFPTARRRRSSAFGRAKLTLWFDIASLEDPALRRDTQLQGLAESVQEILDLIETESSNVAYENIILGGLSHGCAMALSCLLALDHPIGGFVGMSGWLPFQTDLEDTIKGEEDLGVDDNPFGSDDPDNPVVTSDERHREEQDPTIQAVKMFRDLLSLPDLDRPSRSNSAISTPVFLGHGSADEKVKPQLGENAYRTLELVGYNVSWMSYRDHGHWYKIPDEIDDIVGFLRDELGWKWLA
ncbi:phospholipase/carboxylesterase [Xylariales sp. AK1849]|nr:phospholipase/carboxylesterase [Xylariales sp. AK1849]